MATAACRRRGIVSGPVGRLGFAHRRHHDLRDVIRLLRDIELRAIGVEKIGDVLIRDGDLGPDFLLDDFLREQFAPEPFAHVLRGQVALRQLLLEGVVGDVFLRVGVGGVELALRHLDLQRARLRQQNLLNDEVVEEAQLGGQRLLLRQRLRIVPRPPIRLVDVVFARLCGRRRPPTCRG